MTHTYITHMIQKDSKYQSGQQESKNIQEVSNWVAAHGPDIPTADYIRQRYYNKLNIQPPTLEKEQTVNREEVNMDIFISKTDDQIRDRYINKLINMGIMKQGPSKKYQHLFIFDWDDTLLCTSYLSALHFVNLTPQIKQVLNKLDEVVCKLLAMTIEKGEVYIITNATEGWVQYSSKLYLPNAHGFVQKKGLKIISARSKFGQEFPGDYGRWKIQAFKSILKKIDTFLLTNMICMGDSNIQIQAAHCLGKQFDRAVVKTIKFRQTPKPEQMIKQLNLVVQKFRQIFDSNKNLTIRLERKK